MIVRWGYIELIAILETFKLHLIMCAFTAGSIGEQRCIISIEEIAVGGIQPFQSLEVVIMV